MNIGDWLLTSDSPTATRAQRWLSWPVAIGLLLWRGVTWPIRKLRGEP